MDRTVLTGSSGPTPVLTVHGINKKSGSLGLKNRFSSRFPIFTVRPPGPVRFWKQWLFRPKKNEAQKIRISQTVWIGIGTWSHYEVSSCNSLCICIWFRSFFNDQCSNNLSQFPQSQPKSFNFQRSPSEQQS